MNRDEARTKFREQFYEEGDQYIKAHNIEAIIMKIFDHFEQRTCEGCKYLIGGVDGGDGITSYMCSKTSMRFGWSNNINIKDFYCKNWRAK